MVQSVKGILQVGCKEEKEWCKGNMSVAGMIEILVISGLKWGKEMSVIGLNS